MPEPGGSNIEVAQILSEHKGSREPVGHALFEIIEALVLAIVAISTAWSGYQAELWTGHQSELYGQASKLRVEAEGAAVYATQERLYNAATVVEWLKAEAHSDKKLADFLNGVSFPSFDLPLKVGRRLKFVDQKVGLSNTVIVLSADHGAAEIPGYLNEFGGDAKYFNPNALDPKTLEKQPAIVALKKKFGIDKELIQAYFPPYVYLNHDVMRERGLKQAEVERAVAAELEKIDGVWLAAPAPALLSRKQSCVTIIPNGPATFMLYSSPLGSSMILTAYWLPLVTARLGDTTHSCRSFLCVLALRLGKSLARFPRWTSLLRSPRS